MIFYSEKNVYEAAKDRIRNAFRENAGKKFCVAFSGGKDSTTVMHLVHEVAPEFGISKVPVVFLDQEAEAPQTVDYVRKVMHYDWVEPYWIQCFFKEWNASKGQWFNVWGPGEKWCRDKEESGSIKDIIYPKNEYFAKTLESAIEYHFGTNMIEFAGMRIEESPKRRNVINNHQSTGVWKDTGKVKLYCPIFDWSCNDVWYYIFSNHFDYCKLYNYLFSKRRLDQCRVSSFIHENAIGGIKDMKEISPEFYERLQKRVENVNTSVQSLKMLESFAKSLPPYFKDWEEYINYLIDNLVDMDENKVKIRKGYYARLRKWRKICSAPEYEAYMKRMEANIGREFAKVILYEDFVLSKIIVAEFKWVKEFHDFKDELKRANKESV